TSREERERNLGRDGLKVVTTLDPDMIDAAQRAAAGDLGTKGVQAAIATVEVKNGAIRMLMSGQNYEREQRNLVVARKVGKSYQGVRQPGSAFKPFTLVAAFEEGVPPETRFSSASPYRTDEWDNACNCVENAEGASNGGMIDLYDATTNSVNVVFAQLALKIGPDTIVDAATRMGITTPLSPVPSITLGSEEASPLDMASAYATLADEGTYCKPFVISRIVSAKGKVLYKHKDNCKEVLDPDVANLVTELLRGPVQSGTGTAASLGSRPVAGKTGT
ncbi:MAG: penicillin-binding transpeptidase domain-containing protein, partial [Actinomycetota bacterium]